MKSIYLLGLALLVLFSCKDDVYSDDVIYNGNNISAVAASLRNNPIVYLNAQGLPISEKQNKALATENKSETFTVEGFTEKSHLPSYKVAFVEQPADSRLKTDEVYIANRCIYSKVVSISTEYNTFTIHDQSDFPKDFPTGLHPNDTKRNGYSYQYIQNSRYEMQTILDEIGYDENGKPLGFTTYAPFRVSNPENLKWIYRCSYTDWGDFR